MQSTAQSILCAQRLAGKEFVRSEAIPYVEEDRKLILPTEGIQIRGNDHDPDLVDNVSLARDGLQQEKEERFRRYRDDVRSDLANRSPGIEGLRERFHAKIEERARRRREQSIRNDNGENG